MKLSSQRKDPKRSWPEHFLYLVAVGDARGGADELVLDNIVNFASAKLALVLKEKCMVLAVTDIKPRSRGKRDGRKQ
ncbi:unnamed protein product [Hyaloperonospora brassicae]|uniref:Uncharacterized protein n=1 Tax=Hyaloperonospora brassicae TaxID=162125 RepID=A0AAV0TXM3_HYABA|nr:unnamed protein product [Hyaloperonospora brassicae]